MAFGMVGVSRRHGIQLGGTTAVLGLAGCLASVTGDNTTGPTDDDAPNPDDDGNTGATVTAGRIVNETDAAYTFELSILEGGRAVYIEDIPVGSQSTESFSGNLGTVGNTYLIDVVAGDAWLEEEVVYERSESDDDTVGVLEITLAETEELTVAFAPRE